jgi:predicted dienelactone hydrolase
MRPVARPLEGNTLMSESVHEARTVSTPAAVLSVSPVALPAPGRAVDLQVRVSAPVTGGELPVILLSHGHGYSNNLSSLNGYAPARQLLGGARFRRDPAHPSGLSDAWPP